ncbi:MAG: preprotein translocase subunit SecG [Candidatus Omnitrophica bacterium]|nr:preprotein translocase subunit SecG [Candidatus Omnitrophota bacterium]
MTIVLIVLHVIACLVLILVVLLQAGRGGGLSDMAGGQPQSLFGTQTNAFMTRATEICAVVFIITSLSLGIVSTQRGKSLVEKRRLAETVKQSAPVIPAAPASTETKTQESTPAESVSTELTTPVTEGANS